MPQRHFSNFAVLCFIFFITFISPCLLRADSISSTGVQFLEIPTGVRGAGMGGAFTAVADDPTAPYWNTAGLAQIQHLEINAQHISYLAGTNYEFLAGAVPLNPGSTLGLGASYDFVPSFNSTNNPSAIPGSASDLAIELGFGQSFGPNVSFGIGAKFINSNLLTFSATGEAVDGGLLLSTDHRELTLGLSVQNLGQLSSFSQYSTQEDLPMVYRAGLAYRFQPQDPTHFVVDVDVQKAIDSDPIYNAGGEVWIGDKNVSVALRGGYSLNDFNQDLGGLSGASMGVGVKFQDWELDYALVPFGALGDTQRFSLTFELEPEEKIQPPAKQVAVQIQPQIADFKTGSLKQATFELKPMARTDIKNWSLEITDPKGNILRTYSGKGVPPREIAWDGKDANGNVVAGGIFANYNLRTVDTRGQQVLASDPIFRVSPTAIGEREAPVFAVEAAAPRPPAPPKMPENVQPLGLSGVIKLPSLSFREGNSEVSLDYENYLAQVARLIRKYPNSRVYIEGHADDEGSEDESLRLSQYRADSVMRFLVEKENISPDNLYARGHGTAAPLEISGTEIAHMRNRRVDIIILTK